MLLVVVIVVVVVVVVVVLLLLLVLVVVVAIVTKPRAMAKVTNACPSFWCGVALAHDKRMDTFNMP